MKTRNSSEGKRKTRDEERNNEMKQILIYIVRLRKNNKPYNLEYEVERKEMRMYI